MRSEKTLRLPAAVTLRTCFVLVATLSVASVAVAEDRFAVASKFGNVGTGVEVTYSLRPKLNLRLGYQSTFGARAGSGLDSSALLLADWHLEGPVSGFRLSGGLGAFREESELLSGGVTYNPGFRGGGYLGMGWGNAVREGSRWRFSADVGALFSSQFINVVQVAGQQTVSGKSGNAPAATSPNFEVFRGFSTKAVYSLGISYRF